MFDTMTLTKVLGGFCGALLIFLLGGWGAEIIYHQGGHGEEGEQGFLIAVEESDGEAAPEEEGPAFEELFAAADPSSGEGVFRACQGCHAVEPGVNGTGPSLYGVVGREVDSVEGYEYSGALEEVADVWTPENLNHFLEDPRGWAPGTKMTYNGLRSAEDRADLIAWLDSLDN